MKLSDPSSQLNLEIIIRDKKWKYELPNIESICKISAGVAFEAVKKTEAMYEVALVLCDDDFITALNKRYRNIDSPTNILSFPSNSINPADTGFINEPEMQTLMLGDIAIAREIVVHEARELEISLEDHLRHLIIHGLLHLLGYSHETDHDAIAMESLETSLLGEMGVGDPYAVHGEKHDGEVT